jgi:hypothetical protein
MYESKEMPRIPVLTQWKGTARYCEATPKCQHSVLVLIAQLKFITASFKYVGYQDALHR